MRSLGESDFNVKEQNGMIGLAGEENNILKPMPSVV
jgi:hypothetical protein